MTTPIPQTWPYGTYPYTYTVFCTADTKFFNETPPTPFAFFLYNLLLFLYKNTPTLFFLGPLTPGGIFLQKKSKTYIKKVHEISIKLIPIGTKTEPKFQLIGTKTEPKFQLIGIKKFPEREECKKK